MLAERVCETLAGGGNLVRRLTRQHFLGEALVPLALVFETLMSTTLICETLFVEALAFVILTNVALGCEVLTVQCHSKK